MNYSIIFVEMGVHMERFSFVHFIFTVSIRNQQIMIKLQLKVLFYVSFHKAQYSVV